MKITDLIIELGSRIKQHENTAEELFQNLDSPEKGDQELAKATALQEMLDYINDRIEKSLINNLGK